MEGQPVALPSGQLPVSSQPLRLAGSRQRCGHPTGSGDQPQTAAVTVGVPAGSAHHGDVLCLGQRSLCSPRRGERSVWEKAHPGYPVPLLLWWCNLGWPHAALSVLGGFCRILPSPQGPPLRVKGRCLGRGWGWLLHRSSSEQGCSAPGVRTACTWPPRHQEQALWVL